jgi:hypothetical protein
MELARMGSLTDAFSGIIFWVAIGVAIYFAIRKSFRFKGGQIRGQWEALIEQGSGNADAVYEGIEDALKSANPPKVRWERAGIHAGNLMTGKRYDGLKVNNSELKDYRIYIFAYDYGTSLHVAWFLTYQKPWLKFIKIIDIPQQLELNAYGNTVHAATKKAVQTLMERLGQDFSKINTKSKGFLEVW